MKRLTALIILLAGVSIAGVPVKWDVRLGDSSSSSITSPFEITVMNGETTDIEPRFLDRGRPITTIPSNALVRAYFREYGTTNAFVAGVNTGTVYQTAQERGRVKVTTITSDYASTTNEFYVGVDNDGMMFRAWGMLIVQDSVGVNPTTNSNGRTIIDWDTVDNLNEENAPFPLDSELDALDVRVSTNELNIAANTLAIGGFVSTNDIITATLISNKTYNLIFTSP